MDEVKNIFSLNSIVETVDNNKQITNSINY